MLYKVKMESEPKELIRLTNLIVRCQILIEGEQEKKESPRIKEIIEAVGLLVSILVAGTVLLSNSASVPWWWFHFSFIFLIALTFFIPSVIFFKPISKRYNKRKLKRKLDAISRKYFPEFGNLVNNCNEFNFSIEDILNLLKERYSKEINGSLGERFLKSRDQKKIENSLRHIEYELNKSNKTFRDFSLLMKQFEFVLYIYKRNLNIIEDFVHEIRDFKGKEIGKDIEKSFEEFREKYNLFLNDFKKFCHNVNQEVDKIVLSEGSFQPIKKW